MATSIFDNPIVVALIFLGVIGFVVSMLYKRKMSTDKFKDFEPKKFSAMTIRDMKDKINTQGTKYKGHLYIGLKKICRIDMYYIGKGKFALSVYDPKTKAFSVQDTKSDTEYQLMFLRAKSTNIIYRLLGFRKVYYLLNYKEKDVQTMKFDEIGKKIFLPHSTDLTSYGDVWVNSADSIEYINNISMKRTNEEIMMHLENMPDRVVHLEIEQAKRERISKIITDLEKSKWEDRKDAGDTTIQ